MWFWIDSSQEIPINVEFPQVFILVPRLLLLYVDNLPGDVNVFNILPVMDVLLSTPTLSRFLICCNSMSWLLNWLWHKIHTEVGSDLSMLILGTRSLFHLINFINSGVIDINVRVSFLNPKYFLRCYDCLALLVLIKLLEVVLDFKIFVNSWNNVAMPGLLPLITTWICWIWLQNRYLAPLVPHLLLLLSLWLIVDIYPF